MTTTLSPSAGGNEMPLRIRILLGVVFIGAGIVVLGDVVLAAIVSAIFIGICAVAAGVFEIFHAFWTKGWGGMIWQLLLGALYLLVGVTLISQPVAGALLLAWVLGVTLVASGLVRIYLGLKNWADAGALLMLSGIFGVVAGILIFTGWPTTGLWVIGFLLGIDLIFHGIGWLIFARKPTGHVYG